MFYREEILSSIIIIEYLQGTYSTSSGYDTALLENNNFPKVYFYGEYKYVGKVKTKNKLIGCMAYEVEALESWKV